MFLMLQDMAVPHVLVAAGARACGNSKWYGRQLEVKRYRGYFARMHLDGFLPAKLIGLASTGNADRREYTVYHPEGLACQNLAVCQVEVDRVRVSREVENAPDFNRVVRNNLGGRIQVFAAICTGIRVWCRCAEKLGKPSVAVKGFVQRKVTGVGSSVAPAGMLVTLAMLSGWGTPAFTTGVARSGGSYCPDRLLRKRLRIGSCARQPLCSKSSSYQGRCRQAAEPGSADCRGSSQWSAVLPGMDRGHRCT